MNIAQRTNKLPNKALHPTAYSSVRSSLRFRRRVSLIVVLLARGVSEAHNYQGDKNMKNLADAVLDYLWFIEFSEEDELDPDRAVKLEEELGYQIENEWTDDEKQALSEAASRRLGWWLREPDEHGYTPRKLLTVNQKAFLEALASGRFDGYDVEDEEE